MVEYKVLLICWVCKNILNSPSKYYFSTFFGSFLIRATQDSDAWYNKGVSLDDLNKPEEALKAYDKAIGINQPNSKA
jgi:tetratricopeptide (TPR) repeat protein